MDVELLVPINHVLVLVGIRWVPDSSVFRLNRLITIGCPLLFKVCTRMWWQWRQWLLCIKSNILLLLYFFLVLGGFSCWRSWLTLRSLTLTWFNGVWAIFHFLFFLHLSFRPANNATIWLAFLGRFQLLNELFEWCNQIFNQLELIMVHIRW